MDRQSHDYASAMAFAQQQQQAGMQQQQQQPYGFHPPPQQQFLPQMHGPPFLPPHPSMQQFSPYHHAIPPQQLYPQHHHLPSHLQQQPPPYGAHLPAHVLSAPPFVHPHDSTGPPPAAAPPDPELHKRIDKLVEYIAKNGPEFEVLIREKQHDNLEYSFLFGGEGHNYYRYKLWLHTRLPGSPFHSFPSTNMHMIPSSHNSSLNPSMGVPGGPPGSVLHQPTYPPFYDPNQPPPHVQPYMTQSYEPASKTFKGLSGPLPSDVSAELSDVLMNLSGTKESIKGAKMWFMQRSPFAPAMAEVLRERMFVLDDSERQLHIIFLANDILFESLQHRVTPRDLDSEALAFKPVLGSMLARVYNNPQNKDENQSRLDKILQFWASKEVYDPETIASFQSEMTGTMPHSSAARTEGPPMSDSSDFSGSQQAPYKWQQDKAQDQLENDKHHHLPSAAAAKPFPPSQLQPAVFPATQSPFPVSVPAQSAVPPQNATGNFQDQPPPPYPLFPPGLIPGMVRKMQIGSGVPYSPLSPLDIPTVIPPSTVPESEILERVSKFFKEIGEQNPSEGPMMPFHNSDYDDYEKDLPARKGGACIPPPPTLQMNSDMGINPDGAVDSKPGSMSTGRLGLGAAADPNEACQYDDVYSSYRKQRSTSYRSSMSARSASTK